MSGTKKITYKEALDRLMYLCSRAEKSSYDIRKKLTEWQLDNEGDKIIDFLSKENYIDESRYTRAFVTDKIRFNKWGIVKVRYFLKSKQINTLEIEKAIGMIDYEEYKKMVFTELLIKKNILKIKDFYKLKAKLYAFGNQRGYESNLINEFIESSALS
jgi:regulatory protein